MDRYKKLFRLMINVSWNKKLPEEKKKSWSLAEAESWITCHLNVDQAIPVLLQNCLYSVKLQKDEKGKRCCQHKIDSYVTTLTEDKEPRRRTWFWGE